MPHQQFFVLVACALIASGCGPVRTAPRVPMTPPLSPVAQDAVSDAGMPAVAPVTPEAERIARFTATLVGDHLDVTVVLPVDWVPGEVTRVRMAFAEDVPFGEGPPGFVRFLRGLDDAGGEAPFPPWFEVRAGRLQARYRVRLEHHLARPAHGLDDVPHPTRAAWVLPGRSFIPRSLRSSDGRQLDVPARLALRGGDGAHHEGSVARVGDDYAVDSIRQLADAMYVLGAFHQRTLRVDAASILLVTSDWEAASLDHLADVVQRALDQGRARLGALPDRRLFVLFDRNPRAIDGGVVGDAVSVLCERPPSREATSDGGVVTIHEIFHLWNRSRAVWLSEGFDRYFEVFFTTHVDHLSERRALDAMLRVLDRYRAHAHGQTIAAARDSFAYAAGATLAFCMDTHLREHGHDLFEVHRAAREAAPQPPQGSFETIRAEALLASLETIAPATAEYVRGLLEAPGPIDVDACLRRAGYVVTTARYRGFTERALSEEVLGVQSRSDYQARVFAADEGAPLHQDDLIRAVGAVPVASFNDIDRAFAGLHPRTRVVLHVERGGARVDVPITVPALGAEAREEHTRNVVRLLPSPRRRASPFADLAASR